MKALFLTLALALFPVAADAQPCTYCQDVEKLEAGFAKLKPEPENKKTLDQQNTMVEASAEALKKPFSQPKKLAASDWKKLLPFLATAEKFDYQNLLADELLPALGSDKSVFFEALDKAEKAHQVSGPSANSIREAFGTAAAVQEDTVH